MPVVPRHTVSKRPKDTGRAEVPEGRNLRRVRGKDKPFNV